MKISSFKKKCKGMESTLCLSRKKKKIKTIDLTVAEFSILPLTSFPFRLFPLWEGSYGMNSVGLSMVCLLPFALPYLILTS